MHLISLHATGLAWDEIGYLIVPGTLVMGLVLFLTSRDSRQGDAETEGDGAVQLSSEDNGVL